MVRARMVGTVVIIASLVGAAIWPRQRLGGLPEVLRHAQ